MRVLPPALAAKMLAGPPFLGDNYPLSFVTFQPTWWLNTYPTGTPPFAAGAGGVGVATNQMPVRWLVDQAGQTWIPPVYTSPSTTPNPGTGKYKNRIEYVIPTLKQVTYNDDETQDTPTLQAVFFNLNAAAYGNINSTDPHAAGGSNPDIFGNPGFLSFLYGSEQANKVLWNQGNDPGDPDVNTYNTQFYSSLRENALLRWYYGYGPAGISWADAITGGYVIQKGLWLVDTASPDANSGVITLGCRSALAKIMIDDPVYPPLIPQGIYTSQGGPIFVPPMFNKYNAIPGLGEAGRTSSSPSGVATLTKEGFNRQVVDAMIDPNDNGYVVAISGGGLALYDGAVAYGYGGIADIGAAGVNYLPAPVVAVTRTKSGLGYWQICANGSIYPFGDASLFGYALATGVAITPLSILIPPVSLPPELLGTGYITPPGMPTPTMSATGSVLTGIVASKATSTGNGLWLMDSTGNVYVLGDAPALAWAGTAPPGGTVFVDFSPMPSDAGLFCLASTGVVYCRGAAVNVGNYAKSGYIPTCIESSGNGTGYRMVGNKVSGVGYLPWDIQWPAGLHFTAKTGGWPTDGGSILLNQPIIAIRRNSDDTGYWMFGADGGVFTFGDANYYGSLPASNYTLWTASNYVSAYNTGTLPGDYVAVPTGVAPPVNAKPVMVNGGTTPDPSWPRVVWHTVEAGTQQTLAQLKNLSSMVTYEANVLLAPDYSAILRLLGMWCGAWYPPSAGFDSSVPGFVVPGPDDPTLPHTFAPAPFLGFVADSGAYNCQKIGTRVLVATKASDVHGYPLCYDHGCQCDECIEAHRQYDHETYVNSLLVPYTGRVGRPTGSPVGSRRQPSGPLLNKKNILSEKNIEDIVVGDRVLSLGRQHRDDGIKGASRFRRTQQVLAVQRQSYSGDLVHVTTSLGHSSGYTPNHHCIVAMGDSLRGKQIVYLMRKGAQFRVGRTSCNNGGHGGLAQRLAQEHADAVWVLAVVETRAEAALVEVTTGHKYNIPLSPFAGTALRRGDGGLVTSYDLVAFWEYVGDNTANATTCLESFGRDIAYPFFCGSTTRHANPGLHEREACNLLDGMLMVPADDSCCNERATFDKMLPIIVTREPYVGDVVSLLVEEDHSYVADGLLTGNSLGPIDAATFGQQPVMTAAKSLLTAIGFISRFRDDGGWVCDIPNYFGPGNFLELLDASAANYAYVSQIPLVVTPVINNVTVTSTDQPLRSSIIVSPEDPYLWDNAPPFPNSVDNPPGQSHTVTVYTPPANITNILHGIPRPALMGVPLTVPITAVDEALMAEFEQLGIFLASLTVSCVAVYNPAITSDCQIQVLDQSTGFTSIGYVTGVSVVHNLDTGDCLATYTLCRLTSPTTATGVPAWQTGQKPSPTDWALVVSGEVSQTTRDPDGIVVSAKQFSVSDSMVAYLKSLAAGGNPSPKAKAPILTTGG